MGIPIKPSRNLTAKRRIAIKKSGHAHVAAMPFAVSYYFNVDKVSASIPRTALFLSTLAVSSVGVDACSLGIFRNGASPIVLASLYIGQAVAYVLIGPFILGDMWRGGSADQ